jgi:DNA-directed RNA polymerase specialized sigma24 family protein
VLDIALDGLESKDTRRAQLVKLRYLAGLSLDQAAECLGVAPRTADRTWRYARACLYTAMAGPDSGEK